MKGIILAAGLGRRLGRLTKDLPKPLLPVGGIPVIKLNIEKLKESGVKSIGVNVFYKANLIRDFLKNFKGLKVVNEKFLSGTGGALLNFRDFVTKDFLIHNCDVVSNVDLKELVRTHKKLRPLATVVLVNNYRTNRVRISKEKKERVVRFYKKRMDGCYTYSGIAIVSKKIFKYFPEKKKIFSLTEVFNRAIDNGEFIHGLIVKDVWCDIGTLKTYRNIKANKHFCKS